MRMKRYQYRVKTIYQHLFTEEYDVISINGTNESEAEHILAEMLNVRDSYHDFDSSYQTYVYELVNILQ